MSLSSSLLRSPSHVLSSGSRAAVRASTLPAPPYFASAGPTIASHASHPSPSTAKSLATLPPASCTSSTLELAPIWFDSTLPRFELPSGLNPEGPDNERKIKLGKTLRVLQKRLPTLLQSPLPQEIVSQNISLHLFPSTHPYLPTVSGRIAYTAALWTSPIAWNRVPILGNLKIQVLSERMTTEPLHFSPQRAGAYPEQLVVKWRTAEKSSGDSEPSLTEQGEQKLDSTLRGTQGSGSKKEFTGLFIFEFDKDGKIISHTIEHVDQSGAWEKGVGAKVVHLTDWLLGEIRGRQPQGACPMFHATEDGRKDPRS
ncbi:hypothetical protein JX265_006543 [Neoarthrinium moseri]|uniref:Chromosome transmission fidelity protein 4 n=1 Tax=Neoarthrinium moseri TaxID=1658444 RepID=A0A9P9WLX1_9PEZI|nr:hypothetical protein JX265_006543 [Neoarthrinium moseri]